MTNLGEPNGATSAPVRSALSKHFNGDAPIVPNRSIAGTALISVVAIMTLLACLTVGAVSLVADASRDWQNDISREITIQLRPVDGAEISAETEKAVALVEKMPGIGEAMVLDDKEAGKLLAPWLGEGVDLSDLPVPRLILVKIDDPAKVDFPALRTQLAAQIKGAALDDHNAWSKRLRTMSRTVVTIGIAVLALVLTAMVLSIVFATRAAMAGNRDVVDVLHMVGAEDGFIAREFQRHFLLLGLKGGLAGGLAAVVVFLTVAIFGPSSAGSPTIFTTLFGGLTLGPTAYFGVFGIVALVAALTAATSRVAVISQLRLHI